MSREGDNGAYCCNREGVFVCGGWKCCPGERACLYAWKLRGRLLSVVSCVGAGSVKALRGPRDLLRRWRDCWNHLEWGRIRFAGNDLVFVPFVSFTGHAPCVSENSEGGGKFVLLPKNLENVAAFSKFLCPPHLLGSNFPPPFLSVLPLLSLTVPLMFQNPALRHKTAPRICLVETFLLFFLSLLLHLFPPCPFFGGVLTLPVQLRPPEMGNVAGIGAFCRYWEGGFVSGG